MSLSSDEDILRIDNIEMLISNDFSLTVMFSQNLIINYIQKESLKTTAKILENKNVNQTLWPRFSYFPLQHKTFIDECMYMAIIAILRTLLTCRPIRIYYGRNE